MSAICEYYIFLFLIIFQCLLMKKMGKAFTLTLIGCELWFFSAFRGWDIGNDTVHYVNAFIRQADPYGLLGLTHMEQGYLWLNRIVAYISTNPQTILIVTSTLIIPGLFWAIFRYSAFAGMSTVLFAISQCGTVLSSMRQETAFVMFLLAFPFIQHRKFLPFIIICLLASTIHTSILATIPIYWVYTMPWKPKYIISFIIIGLLCTVLLAPLLQGLLLWVPRYQGYVGTRLLGEEAKIGAVFKTIVAGGIFVFEVFTYYIHKHKLLSQSFPLPISFLLFMALCTCLIQMFGIHATLLSRIAFYFNFFSLFSIPIFIRVYSGKVQPLVIAVVFGGLIAWETIIMIFRPGWNVWLPYHFCF